MVVHLAPEQLACIGIVCVIEAAEIAGAYPVADRIAYGTLVHPAVPVEFLVMVGGDVELGPYRYHHVCVHVVDGVYHTLGIGETLLVELVASP